MGPPGVPRVSEPDHPRERGSPACAIVLSTLTRPEPSVPRFASNSDVIARLTDLRASVLWSSRFRGWSIVGASGEVRES
jgi:hypothetical protein